MGQAWDKPGTNIDMENNRFLVRPCQENNQTKKQKILGHPKLAH